MVWTKTPRPVLAPAFWLNEDGSYFLNEDGSKWLLQESNVWDNTARTSATWTKTPRP